MRQWNIELNSLHSLVQNEITTEIRYPQLHGSPEEKTRMSSIYFSLCYSLSRISAARWQQQQRHSSAFSDVIITCDSLKGANVASLLCCRRRCRHCRDEVSSFFCARMKFKVGKRRGLKVDVRMLAVCEKLANATQHQETGMKWSEIYGN